MKIRYLHQAHNPRLIVVEETGQGFSLDEDGFLRAKFFADREAGLAEEIYPDLESRKLSLREQLADKRWRVECGGFVLPNGVKVATDDRSKLLAQGAYIKAKEDSSFSTSWKTDAGWVVLNSSDLIALYVGMLAWVDQCFLREKVIEQSIAQVSDFSEIPAIEETIRTFW